MCRSILLLVLLTLMVFTSRAQVTTDPQFPMADQQVTITVDVSGTGLGGYNGDVWLWAWLPDCTANCDAPTNVNPATGAQNAARMTKSNGNSNIYTITLTPTVFFQKEVSEINKIGLLLKGTDWGNGQTPDYIINMSTGGLEVLISSPEKTPLFIDSGESIIIEASSSAPCDLEIKINGVTVAASTSTTQITHTEVSGAAAKYLVEVAANDGTDVVTASTYFIVRSNTEQAPLPEGTIKGINYSADNSKVTLCLLAPLKSSVYAVGSFSNWEIDPEFEMKQDGELYWLEISNLNSGEEYPFHYLVDENIYIADPHSDKILDPDDQYIPSNAYPNLITYPTKALEDEWYYNRLSVIQTGQTPFQWTAQNYIRPKKESLVIYELLIRDFFGEGQKTYANLIDTLSYLDKLGINAIELMPIMEFNGNDSWGYNPTFMFAPDKFYGPKDKLKEFIDEAHKRDIAVILDIAMNHNDIPAPYALMYFDFNSFKPTANNPWFNTDAKHPFNVFYDYNHESLYTQELLDSINNYWINQYKVDGFRFDLSKGFTQTNSGNDVGKWGEYDASRINILKRMADEIWSADPDAFVILEHFAENSEETELAEYGMMLWGNVSHAYGQNSMGYSDNSSISWSSYLERGWTQPHLISYMESHDEERMMYKNLEFGNEIAGYSTKDLPTALDRVKAAATLFYLIPGPKMLWQFGELGYDFSINTCPDGSINNDCRIAAKPIPWNDEDDLNYNNDEDRNLLRLTFSELIKLKTSYPIFSTTDLTIHENGLAKQIVLKSQNYTTNPSNPDEMNAVVIGNFGMESASIAIEFSHTGVWYDYFSAGSITNVEMVPTNIEFAPGQFNIYTDIKLPSPPNELVNIITSLTNDRLLGNDVFIYPNPTKDQLFIESSKPGYNISVLDVTGKTLISATMESVQKSMDLTKLANGIYFVQLKNKMVSEVYRVVKE